MNLEEAIAARVILQQALDLRVTRKIEYLFPDDGPLRRDGYARHIEFFMAGAVRRTRCFLAGNRVGKSVAGCAEMAYHLTGRYPGWWKGKKFTRPIKAWACGLTNTKVRDSLQGELCGQVVRDPKGPKNQLVGLGTGLLPADSLLYTRPKQGIADAFDMIHIRHVSGGVSVLWFKSYDSGVDAFSAEAIDVVHLDEEPDKDIYTECVIRTMTRKGIVMITATPLLGMTELVVELMEAYRTQAPLDQPSTATYVVMAGWDDAPHLSEEDKADLYAKIPAYQRDARVRGIPQLGSGAIYPIEESAITVAPFEIPDYWPRSFAMDVGNNTAVLWGTTDRNTGVYYLYREYFRAGDVEHVPPSVHAAAVKGHKNRDQWIPGVVDPAARGRSQTDGNKLIEMYADLGLELTPAVNAVEAGLHEVFDAYSTGKLKIFSNLVQFWSEFRLYQRDKNGRVVKKHDHLMDAKRYWWMSSRDIMRTRPAGAKPDPTHGGPPGAPGSWMG